MNAQLDRPNILLITSDQQRGDCLGLENHPVLQTPHIDFLGASGTWFRRAYSEVPSCIPARRTLMSGQAPASQGMVGFLDKVDWLPQHTLAGELANAGYQCEMVGKLHLWPLRKHFGFHHMQLADSTAGGHQNDYHDWLGGATPIEFWAVAHGATPNGWIGRPNHLPETQTHSFWCVTEAIKTIEKRDPTRPFFVNVSFIDPHPPLTPPQFYFDRYAALDLPKPQIGSWARQAEGPTKGGEQEGAETRGFLSLDEQTMHYCRAGYFGLINHVDTQVGRLIEYLRRRRILDNTFVLFTSDHGEMLGDHNMFAKSNPFEPSARVPFVARAAKTMGLPRNVVTSAPVGLQDVLPTLLDVAGAGIPDSVTGRSVLPLMRGETPDAADWRTRLHGEHAPSYAPDDGMHYLVDSRFKYIWYSERGHELFFDLERDPLELTDLSNSPEHAALVAARRAELIDILRGRPEGFTDGHNLIPGPKHDKLVPRADGAPLWL